MKSGTAILATLVVALALSVSGLQKSEDTPGLFRVKVNGKYGFINRSGKIVIAPVYDDAQPFRDGLSPVRVGGKYGFIDSEGQLIIQPQFEQVDWFSEGLAGVKVGSQWGFIDKSGKMVIEPRYRFALSFNEGLASVSLGNIDGYIDKTGKMVFTVEANRSGSSFSEGFARVSLKRLGEYEEFFIDHTGKRAFPGTYYMVADFSDGLAVVYENKDKRGYIDHMGKVVIPFQNWATSRFVEGLATANLPKKGEVYIDKTGKPVITGDFFTAGPFSEGLAAVQLRTGPDSARTVNTPNGTVTAFTAGVKYGYIDKTGKVVIPAQFEDAGRFKDGLAQVCLESTARIDFMGAKKPCGYIDTTGKFVWGPSE